MYKPAETVKRRLNVHAPPRIRSVDVARGRAGYGFTLSGQAPCVLSCVMKGSPADYVGLKAGDQIFAVNDINVKKASHEDVVKLIGKCSGVLHMIICEGISHMDSCSSDEEVGFYEGKGWLKPKLDSKALGINRAERVVEEMQSGGIFSMIFENPTLCAASSDHSKLKQRSLSESAAAASRFDIAQESLTSPNYNLHSKDEMSKVIHDDSVFSIGLENHDDFGLDASILNVAMVVGYLGSIELPSTSSNLEYDSLQAIRGCMRRLRAEQKIHSLVMMKIMHDCIQLCTDKAGVVAEYPAEKLAFSAVCPDDRRFFGLVTMQTNDDGSLAQEDEGVLRTSCHVFMVDPELFSHKIHQGIARRFGFDCTADPDTNGCLEFPTSSLPVLQFISVLYRDMGELIEGMRARAFLDGDADAHQNNSTSSNSDSGIGNFNQEEKSNRVLVVDLGGSSSKHIPSNLWENPGGRAPNLPAAHWNGFCHDSEGSSLEPTQNDKFCELNKHLGPSSRMEIPLVSSRSSVPPSKRSATGMGGGANQRWLPVHVLQEWQHGHASDQESYTDSTDGWSSVNCGTLPPPMNKIPADRYRVEGSFVQPQLSAHKSEWSKKAFGMQNFFGPHRNVRKMKEDKKSSKFGIGLLPTPQRTSTRRSFGRSKRFSITRSLDDLESATVSDGELNSTDLKDCVSNNSLSSNASLPSVQSCRRLRERRVASWAVSFERLLQDPIGVRYFSDFLRKEFSEENILFWQACEYFSHVPAHDKKELSYRAREIFTKFLCSKATTPVNIDSQAQLADDILNAPHPDMFKEQQLQIFNLMKFDSYTRFLKSQLYQECILAEVEGRSLPDSQQVPSSPASKHSISSDRSNVSTPKKSGEKEPLDLGVPISNLDGQRVILEEKDPTKGKVFTDKQKGASAKQNIAVIPSSRNHSATGEERTLGKSNSIKIKGENGKNARDPRLSKREESIAKIGKKKYQKINLDEAEEFFELISKAQSNRADDQRGLLRKEDLVLPEFLRLPPCAAEPTASTPAAAKGLSKRTVKNGSKEKAAQPNGKLESPPSGPESPAKSPGPAESKPRPPLAALPTQKSYSGPFSAPLSPIPRVQEAQIWKRQSEELPGEGIQTIDDDNVADLTLVGEGDISSPNSTLLPPPPTPPSDATKLTEANYTPPTPLTDKQEKPGYQRSVSGANHGRTKESENFCERILPTPRHDPSSCPGMNAGSELPVNRIIDVDGVKGGTNSLMPSSESEGNLSFEGSISELRMCQGRTRTGVYRTSDLPSLLTVKSEKHKSTENQYKATFV
ncbi:regulator of G-protein signaling 12 isoform X2 [Sarcophilus harrisii]|uniref:regulator of G-protein signaling 12 isoform X2 n=1 Tax=Sarcophilus harrisii TaxID=9305 RepID=UPI001301C1D2|nr:regulator of G-protein signaling 12 isoform X2 [Sarcophilus harrisii]